MAENVLFLLLCNQEPQDRQHLGVKHTEWDQPGADFWFIAKS